MRKSFKQIQGISHSSFNQYEQLQDLIWLEKKVRCTVVVTPDHVSIKTAVPGNEGYSDFLLAKLAIKGRTCKPIIRCE